MVMLKWLSDIIIENSPYWGYDRGEAQPPGPPVMEISALGLQGATEEKIVFHPSLVFSELLEKVLRRGVLLQLIAPCHFSYNSFFKSKECNMNLVKVSSNSLPLWCLAIQTWRLCNFYKSMLIEVLVRTLTENQSILHGDVNLQVEFHEHSLTNKQVQEQLQLHEYSKQNQTRTSEDPINMLNADLLNLMYSHKVDDVAQIYHFVLNVADAFGKFKHVLDNPTVTIGLVTIPDSGTSDDIQVEQRLQQEHWRIQEYLKELQSKTCEEMLLEKRIEKLHADLQNLLATDKIVDLGQKYELVLIIPITLDDLRAVLENPTAAMKADSGNCDNNTDMSAVIIEEPGDTYESGKPPFIDFMSSNGSYSESDCSEQTDMSAVIIEEPGDTYESGNPPFIDFMSSNFSYPESDCSEQTDMSAVIIEEPGDTYESVKPSFIDFMSSNGSYPESDCSEQGSGIPPPRHMRYRGDVVN